MPNFLDTFDKTGSAHIEGNICPDGAMGGAVIQWHDLDAFTQGYIEALFFTWPEDEGGYVGGITSPRFADLAPDTLAKIIADCAKFQADAAAPLDTAITSEIDYDMTEAGRDFWFTRNGCGCGFWDRGLGEVGDLLSDVARRYGTRDAYLGDDRLVYAC